MKNINSLSLRLWLPILVLGLFLILLAGATWQTYLIAKATLIESNTSFIRQDMFSLQQEIARALLKNDISHAKTALSSRGVNPNYQKLALIDQNDSIMLATDLELTGRNANILKHLDNQVLNTIKKNLQAEVIVHADNKIITAYFPTSLSLKANEIRPSSIGALFLTYSLQNSENAVWQKVQQTMLPIAISLFFAMFILIAFLNRFILQPIVYLKNLTSSFSDTTSPEDLELKGAGELADFSREFKKMLLKRRLYEHKLQQGNKELSATLSELAAQKYALDQHSLVAVTNINGDITYVNEKFCSVSGYSEGELIGNNHRMLSSRTHDDEFFKLMYQTITNGVVWHGEICNRSKNGNLYWLDTTIVPFMDEEIKPQSYITIRTDITHRKTVLQKLAESEQNLLLAQKTAQLGHFSYNILSSEWKCSKELENVFGIDSDYKKDFAGWMNLIHPEDQQMMDHHFKHQVMTEHQRLDKEYRTLDLNTGAEKWVHCIGKLKFDSNNHPVEIFGTIQDITHRKHVEIALQRAKKMEAIGQLTGGIAHDFNNILGIIIGNLDLLQKQFVDNDKAQNRILSALKSASRAANLTKQLLGFSQIKTVECLVSNVNDLIKNIDDVIDHSMGQKIDVRYDFEPDLWAIQIDRGELQDALLNLLLNARDAMKNNGQILIATSNKELDLAFCETRDGARPGQYVQISVSDNGEGISETNISHIFEPFFTTKSPSKGSGLGLAMVFGFVKRSGGYIEVESKQDSGTAFHIYFPRCEMTLVEGADNKPLNEIQPDSLKGYESVLVVDDEQGLVELAKTTLHELGYQVETANNAQQALEMLSHNSDIKLVFSDVIMPGEMNGFELAEKLKSEYPDILVLLTSGYTGKVEQTDKQTTPNFEVLDKPYTQQEMSQLIRKILDDKEIVPRHNNLLSEAKLT